MTKSLNHSTRLLLVAALAISLAPGSARADNGGMGKSLQLRAATYGPVGTIYSLGAIKINGHSASGQHLIWGGELLSAEEASASADMTQVGRVVFSRGSIARLLTSVAGDPVYQGESTLVAVVAAGPLVISLQPNAVANVEIGGSVFRSTRGSIFRVGIISGKPFVEVESGALVKDLQQPRVRYPVKSAKLDHRGRPIGQGPDHYRVQTDHFELIPVTVEVKPQPAGGGSPRGSEAHAVPVSYQAVPPNQPAIGIDVEFCLKNPVIGSLGPTGTQCATVTTDPFGVAKTQFHAGRDKGTSIITATVVASRNDFWEGTIEVYKGGLGRLRNRLILAGVAGGGVIVCVLFCGPGGSGPLHQGMIKIP